MAITALDIRKSDVDMDPRLQRTVDRRARGLRLEATVSAEADEIPVLALVSNADRWMNHAAVNLGMIIGGQSDGSYVVTGRVAVNQIEPLRAERDLVLSLKAAQSLHPTLAAGVREIQATPDVLSLTGRGDGVVVGIVDYGCDFQHENLRTGTGETRVEKIWHQAGSIDPLGAVSYGRVYSRTDINAALRMPDPYTALGYGPDPDTPFEKGSHVTHVMDIAAGNGRGLVGPGRGSGRDLYFRRDIGRRYRLVWTRSGRVTVRRFGPTDRSDPLDIHAG
jgi:hypothetical protein